MAAYPKVKLDPCTLARNRWKDGNRCWSIASLIEAAKGLEPFDLPLCCIYIAAEVFQPVTTAKDLAEHVMRVNAVDMSHPVILDAEGFIMDGWHRVVRALAEGRDTIKAVRFEVTPEPNYLED